jgi:hypothetical protein
VRCVDGANVEGLFNGMNPEETGMLGRREFRATGAS